MLQPAILLMRLPEQTPKLITGMASKTLSMVPTAQINFSGRIPGTRDNTGPVYRPLKSGSTVTDERGYKHTIV